MAYTVLARKYRSWTFKELVGQEAVATTLTNAINSQRIHHGYLFTGTRGVGKTSAARVLARSLNCLTSEGPTAEPCLKCESCLSIAEGQDVDVIEIDAASNTGVDNIRELRSNANYRPARARYKIYIIDEVHMLSTGAFNALLKTLEEPPGHVKFILATTDPQKVPATIQSRCLRFDFRSLSVDEIAGHFGWILQQEGVEADEAVLRRIARLANGSMRDGLSLLDQMLSVGQSHLTLELLEDILPTVHDEVLVRLIGQLADRDAAGALQSLDDCLSAGYSLDRFAEALTAQIRSLMLLNICGAETMLVDLPMAARDDMIALAQQFEPESYVYMIAVMEELRRNVRFSALGRALMEAGIVRLAGAVSYRSIQTLLEQLPDTGAAQPQPAPAPRGAAGRPTQPAPARQAGSAPPPGAGRWSKGNSEPNRSAGSTRRASNTQAGAGRGAGRPKNEQPARPTAPPNTAPSQDDMKAATSEPMVREAMELFDGSLVNVERNPKKD